MKMILFAAALALAASPALAKGKEKHEKHEKHHCVDASGAEVKTAKGDTIKRAKTCKKNKGEWKAVEGAKAEKAEEKKE